MSLLKIGKNGSLACGLKEGFCPCVGVQSADAKGDQDIRDTGTGQLKGCGMQQIKCSTLRQIIVKM